jgi:hypothetical protein
MSTTLLSIGLACMIAAIVGGGLKAFQMKIPTLQSLRRQGILAAFGFLLVIGAYAVQQSGKPEPVRSETELLDTKNNEAVLNGPPKPTEFEIHEPFYVTSIWDYHWNEGQGTTPGNISFRRSDGQVFGPWEVTAADVEGKINWECKPNTRIPPGKYTVVDSEPESWSWNSRTGGMGMTKVKGRSVK